MIRKGKEKGEKRGCEGEGRRRQEGKKGLRGSCLVNYLCEEGADGGQECYKVRKPNCRLV